MTVAIRGRFGYFMRGRLVIGRRALRATRMDYARYTRRHRFLRTEPSTLDLVLARLRSAGRIKRGR